MNRTLAAVACAIVLSGCGATTKDTMERDKMPELAPYPAPPAGAKKVRAGIVEFEDKSRAGVADAAGEQLETQVVGTDRFNVIDRMGMKKLVHEQGLEGIVDASELAKPGRIRGIDYMFMGSVTNFRVMTNTTSATGGFLEHAPIPGVKYSDRKTVISTDVGVDIKLVNTTTGEIVAKEFGEVKRTIEASSWGLKILDIGGNAKNEVKIDRDSQGKLLRLAVDEALRKMLLKIDGKLSQPAAAVCPKCKTELPAGTKFCAKCGTSVELAKCSCGTDLEPGAKFCGKCGKKVGE